MIRLSSMTISIIIASTLLAHGEDCMKPKTEEIRNLLRRELWLGDTREKVENVLKNAGIAFEYDRFLNRYQSTIADSRCGPYVAITVYVNFDSSEKMSKVDVFESYTVP